MPFAGRLVMVNSVLSSLPLFYFSFYKAPKKVIKRLVSLQRNFLWAGDADIKKISWVAWERICLPKSEGGAWG